MKNLILRATRTFNENLCAPEYANNELVVEILHPDSFSDTQELSVSVYGMDYRLLGRDTCQLKGKKRSKARFHILSDEVWDIGLYRMYIYRNGRPQWMALVELYSDYERWDKTEVDDLADRPEDKFFAEELCYVSWWSRLHQARCSDTLIRQFIEFLYHQKYADEPVSNLLVTGERARMCACYILASHFSYGKATDRYWFSLQELADGTVSWNTIQQQMYEKKVIMVEVSCMEFSSQMVNLLNLLGSLLAQKDPSRALFIFYGTDGNTVYLKMKCEVICQLFTENNTLFTCHNTGKNDMEDNSLLENLPLPFEEADLLPRKHDTAENDSQKISSAEKSLQEMVGLQRLKTELQEARMMALFNQKRRKLCLDTEVENRHHMLFFGNPGTGKTTVAKLVGQMYHEMGLLSKGHTIETCRTHLVGEYIGETEKHMKEVIQEARGGVLFIDEAYTLIHSEEDSKDFGKEVIHALLTVLSEPNPDMIVILAGYENKMQQLLQINPGLQDRFPLHFHFDDYSADELMDMACYLLQKRHFELTEEAETQLRHLIVEVVSQRDEHFGNGRWIHNLIEQYLIKSMAQRVMSQRVLPDDIRLFRTIEIDDVLAASKRLHGSRILKLAPPARIGFRA